MPPIIAQRLEMRQRRMTPRDVYTQTGELELAEDFPQRIRQAREARGWKQADLGAKINERVSVIAKLESGTISPGDSLVRKLERELGIKLKERVEPVAAKKPAAGGGRSEEHTSELQSRGHLVCRLLLEKKKQEYR